jgi:hypothetical protein
MSRLEELHLTQPLGILPSGLVPVVNRKWHGSAALELTFKSAEGKQL